MTEEIKTKSKFEEFHEFDNKFEGVLTVYEDELYLIYMKAHDKGQGEFSKFMKHCKTRYKRIVTIIPGEKVKGMLSHLGFKENTETFQIMEWNKDAE